jgi:hypothetical protein
MSWKGKAPLTESCCIEAFDAGAQVYEEPGGALDIVPASGWFIATAVKVTSLPTGPQTILRNGNVIGEGWELVMDAGLNQDQIDFRLTVNAVTSEVNVDFPTAVLENLQLIHGSDFGLWYRVFAWFYPPGSLLGGVNGAFRIRAENFSATSDTSMVAPYVNSSPDLFAGLTLEDPNCIMGLVGGNGVLGDGTDDMPSVAIAWSAEVGPYEVLSDVISDYTTAAYQIVAVPDITGLGNIVNTNGWRPAPPPGVAPNPLEPFIGVPPLVYAIDPGPDLRVDCEQPTVFLNELLSFG